MQFTAVKRKCFYLSLSKNSLSAARERLFHMQEFCFAPFLFMVVFSSNVAVFKRTDVYLKAFAVAEIM
jgi:hypothetical protein